MRGVVQMSCMALMEGREKERKEKGIEAMNVCVCGWIFIRNGENSLWIYCVWL